MLLTIIDANILFMHGWFSQWTWSSHSSAWLVKRAYYAALLIAFAVWLWYAPYNRLPPPGYAAAGIGVLAAFLSIDAGNWPKAGCLVLIGLCMSTELRAIKKDRVESDRKALADRKDQDQHFQDIRKQQDLEFKSTAKRLDEAIQGVGSTLRTASTNLAETLRVEQEEQHLYERTTQTKFQLTDRFVVQIPVATERYRRETRREVAPERVTAQPITPNNEVKALFLSSLSGCGDLPASMDTPPVAHYLTKCLQFQILRNIFLLESPITTKSYYPDKGFITVSPSPILVPDPKELPYSTWAIQRDSLGLQLNPLELSEMFLPKKLLAPRGSDVQFSDNGSLYSATLERSPDYSLTVTISPTQVPD